MAILPETNPNQNDNINEQNDDISFFYKTVVLRNWWLIKSENDVGGKSLAISGYASSKKQAQRLFNSAPITKRHDVFTLETLDGIHIILQGFINKDRTLQSGFSSEVFDQFVFGFPSEWEECVEQFFVNAGNSGTGSGNPQEDVISKDDCNVDVRKDCSPIVPEKFGDGTSEGNFEDHAEIFPYSGQEEMDGPNNNIDGMEEPTVSQDQGKHSIPMSSTDKSVASVRNIALGNTPSTTGRHIISVNSTEVRKVVLAITSSQRKKSIGKGKVKGSPFTECMERSTNAVTPPSQRVSVGTARMALTVSSNKPKTCNRKQKERDTDKDVFQDVVTNFSDVPSVLGNMAASGCYDQNQKKSEKVSAEVLAPGDSNGVTPPSVERNKVHPVSSKSKSGKNVKLLSNLKYKGKNKHVSGCSTKSRGKNIPEAMKRAASRLRSVEWSLNTKEKNEQKATSESGSSKKAKRKISYDAQGSPATEKREVRTSILSPESLSFKRSRSGRLLLPALDFWRNQIPVYDADRNITGIQEEIVAAKPSKGSKSEPQKKQKRRR